MFDLVNGLPVHALVVHVVVVLLPLAILGTVAIAVRRPWRARYGPLVVLVTAVATAFIPVATSSGEAFEKRVGDPGRHAHLGDQLIWFAIPLLVLVLVLVVADRLANRRTTVDDRPDGTSTRRRGGRVSGVVALLAVVAAVASGVQVYRVGDSGARAAWGDRVSAR